VTTRTGWTICGSLAAASAVGGYLGLVSGALPADLGVGRRTRQLGPLEIVVAAPREVVFDVAEEPYLPRTTRAMQAKVQVLDRGSDMVLAAHRTPLRGPLVATTTETVRFTRPTRIDFRLVRGPVPHVVESFELMEWDRGTRLVYTGELGTDLGWLGQRWADVVARSWERVVADSLDAIKQEAERRAGRG
jgi:hypothetical protein